MSFFVILRHVELVESLLVARVSSFHAIARFTLKSSLKTVTIVPF